MTVVRRALGRQPCEVAQGDGEDKAYTQPIRSLVVAGIDDTVGGEYRIGVVQVLDVGPYIHRVKDIDHRAGTHGVLHAVMVITLIR